MRYWLLLIVPFAAFLVGCPVPPTPDTPVQQWYREDPVTGRGYYLYVPQKYSHEKPMPVLISCHGTPPYDVAEHHIRTWRWYGETHGCIVICPTLDGTDGIFGDGPIGGMTTNERNILSILSSLSYQYNIDRNNIMITGFSGGGFPAYWVGLRHPDIFSCVVAQNCNFSRSNTDGWYPPEAIRIPVMVYYGENDPGTIIDQSKNAIEYLRSRGFKVTTYVIPGAGHDRHPEIAMKFFLNHMRPPKGTRKPVTNSHSPNNSTTPDTDNVILHGPRPPAP